MLPLFKQMILYIIFCNFIFSLRQKCCSKISSECAKRFQQLRNIYEFSIGAKKKKNKKLSLKFDKFDDSNCTNLSI